MNEVKIQWHPGFVAAVNLELAENRDDLIYEKEYNLNTKPLEIDLLVIKKDKNVQITNEIGRIFQDHNILEYRSPEDHLDIDSFYKAGAYASLYKAYGETLDESGKNHGWLKSLSGKLKKQEMEALLKRARSLSGKLDRELADAVLEVSVQANREIVEELKGDEAMCQALLEIMEPEINQIVRQATEKERREKEEAVRQMQKEKDKAARQMQKEKEEAARQLREEAEKSAIKMIKLQKFTIEEIQECIPKLSMEDIKRLAQNVAQI